MYVERANVDPSVTPSGRQVAEECVRQCDLLGAVGASVGLRNALSGITSASSGGRHVQKWGRTCRQKWDLGFGNLPVREPMPDAEVQHKAGSFCSMYSCQGFRIWRRPGRSWISKYTRTDSCRVRCQERVHILSDV